ncbi:MAG: hypothetical protein Q6361_01155, partial [Candidatus Hermodarchaeota archaeon]|nr:hypothetical protein [Candidatus Hermodarchaeota archaeon]
IVVIRAHFMVRAEFDSFKCVLVFLSDYNKPAERMGELCITTLFDSPYLLEGKALFTITAQGIADA